MDFFHFYITLALEYFSEIEKECSQPKNLAILFEYFESYVFKDKEEMMYYLLKGVQ